jgi:integrase
VCDIGEGVAQHPAEALKWCYWDRPRSWRRGTKRRLSAGIACPGAGEVSLTKGSYRAFWRRLLKETGLTNARPHDARHTVATLGAMAGGTAFALRDSLGHKTVAMTSGYVARTVDPIRELSEAVGNKMEANPNSDLVAGQTTKPFS